MKKITTAILFLATMLASQATTLFAVPTFYWPGEDGGRIGCDHNRLHLGDAAVDFNVIPKGSVINLGGIMNVVARDCGGSAVISRKAARERHLRAIVIDIWAPSQREALRMEALFSTRRPTKVTYSVTQENAGRVRHHHYHHRLIAAYVCQDQSSKPGRVLQPMRQEHTEPKTEEEGVFVTLN